jgi:hypothetical protein
MTDPKATQKPTLREYSPRYQSNGFAGYNPKHDTILASEMLCEELEKYTSSVTQRSAQVSVSSHA